MFPVRSSARQPPDRQPDGSFCRLLCGPDGGTGHEVKVSLFLEPDAPTACKATEATAERRGSKGRKGLSRSERQAAATRRRHQRPVRVYLFGKNVGPSKPRERGCAATWAAGLAKRVLSRLARIGRDRRNKGRNRLWLFLPV